MNTSAFGVEKGTLIRVPATANLMLDSANRNTLTDISGLEASSPWTFTITRGQPLINGFFTRIGTTEVVLEWCVDNISNSLGNTAFTVYEASGNATRTVNLPPGPYTVYDALESIVSKLNFGGINTYEIVQLPSGEVSLVSSAGVNFRIIQTKLSNQLSFTYGNISTNLWSSHAVSCPDLRPYRYLDFVCEQLTYVQDVKDASTAQTVRDVLCRWYFADDAPNQLDPYGFPILMGYTRFAQRRIFNPPKQIKWEQNQQVGGFLQFSVYGNDGDLVKEDFALSDSNWLMTLQLTEG